ncbi:MAG: MTH1187 family thiamine-binding protein [Euryarchaeota archaeon]|nr:MTH1187 family thiamine-binding protein [Euryarchaeota archaeon]
MIVADVSVVPLGVGTSVSAYVKKAVKALDESGLKLMHGPMSTSLEARTVEEVFSAVGKAHGAVIAAGAKRVVTTVKIDDRRDKDHTMATKLGALEG